MDKSIDDIKKNLLKDISDAEYVLIGIGDEIQYDWNRMADSKRYSELSDDSANDDLIPFFQKIILKQDHIEKIDKAYDNLSVLIKDKEVWRYRPSVKTPLNTNSKIWDTAMLTLNQTPRNLHATTT